MTLDKAMLEIYKNISELPGAPKPLDPESAALLAGFKNDDSTSIFDLAINDVRDAFNPIFEQSAAPIPKVAHCEELTIEWHGQTVNLVEITPMGEVPKEGWPALLFLHGGGWILGDYPSYEWLAKSLCVACGMKVIFIEYNLSPEVRFPGALEQVMAVVDYLQANLERHTLDGNKFAIVGDSAGGNLAAASCIKIRDTGMTSPIQLQCLIYPFIDLRPGIDYESRNQFGNGEHFLTAEHIEWSRFHYLADNRQAESPLVSPITQTSFAGLPKTLVVTAGYDPLKDEGHAYYSALLAAGVDSTLLHFSSTIHAFLSFSAQLSITNDAITHISQHIKEAFS